MQNETHIEMGENIKIAAETQESTETQELTETPIMATITAYIDTHIEATTEEPMAPKNETKLDIGIIGITANEIEECKKIRERELAAKMDTDRAYIKNNLSAIIKSAKSDIETMFTKEKLEAISGEIKKTVLRGGDEYRVKVASFSKSAFYFQKIDGWSAIWGAQVELPITEKIVLEFLNELVGGRTRELYGYEDLKNIRVKYNYIFNCFELKINQLFSRLIDLPLLLYFTDYFKIMLDKVESIGVEKTYEFNGLDLFIVFKL